LSETYKAYGAGSVEDFDVFFKFIEQKFLSKFFTGILESRYAYCNSLFRSFNYEVKNGEGVYYKQMLFDRMVQTFLNTPKNVTSFARSKHGYYLCSSILTHQFYQHSQTLRFQQEGSLRYLPSSELAAKPQLPEVFWSIYRQNPQAINYVSYLANTIRDVYPEHYIPSKGESVTTIEPFLETEMKIRAESVLV
jgi:hypothetical protein